MDRAHFKAPSAGTVHASWALAQNFIPLLLLGFGPAEILYSAMDGLDTEKISLGF